jgi:hypothetical protein
MNYLEIANSLGVPVAMLVFLCVIGTWIVRRVFGSDGLGTKLVAAHVVFLHRIEALTSAILKHDEEQLSLLQKAAATTTKCFELHTQPGSGLTTLKLHRAGVKFARLCEVILKQNNINGEAKELLAEMRHELES